MHKSSPPPPSDLLTCQLFWELCLARLPAKLGAVALAFVLRRLLMTFNTMSVLLYCNCYLMYLPSPTESKALMTEDLSFCVPKTWSALFSVCWAGNGYRGGSNGKLSSACDSRSSDGASQKPQGGKRRGEILRRCIPQRNANNFQPNFGVTSWDRENISEWRTWEYQKTGKQMFS